MHPLFNQQVILEDDHARLTPLQLTDMDSLSEIAFEPSIWTYGMSNLRELTDLEKYIVTALREKEQGLAYPFLIYNKIQDKVAGCTRFGNISFEHKRLEIGWTWLHPKHQGTGINKSCKYLLLKYAFEILGMNRVELKTDLLNLQSQQAMRKIGATQEGVFRRHQITSTGRVRDSIFFSIIHDEWLDLKESVFKDFM
jgi:N-acetyltransferase